MCSSLMVFPLSGHAPRVGGCGHGLRLLTDPKRPLSSRHRPSYGFHGFQASDPLLIASGNDITPRGWVRLPTTPFRGSSEGCLPHMRKIGRALPLAGFTNSISITDAELRPMKTRTDSLLPSAMRGKSVTLVQVWGSAVKEQRHVVGKRALRRDVNYPPVLLGQAGLGSLSALVSTVRCSRETLQGHPRNRSHSRA